MKHISVFLTFVFFAAAAFALPDNIGVSEMTMDDNNYDVNKAAVDFVKGKFGVRLYYQVLELMEQMKITCPNFEKDFEREFKVVRACAEHGKLNSKDTICQTIKNHLYSCNKPVRDLLSSCMPPQAKDLPEIMSKIVAAILDVACKSTGEQMLELMNPCQFTKEFDDFTSCKAVKTEINNFSEKFPTKTFICSLIPKIKNCSNDRHAAACSNHISRMAFVHFHEAIDNATTEICTSPSTNEVS